MATNKVGQISVEVIADASKLNKGVQAAMQDVSKSLQKQAQDTAKSVDRSLAPASKAIEEKLSQPIEAASSSFDKFVKQTVPNYTAATSKLDSSTSGFAKSLLDSVKGQMSLADQMKLTAIAAKGPLATSLKELGALSTRESRYANSSWAKFTTSLKTNSIAAFDSVKGGFTAVTESVKGSFGKIQTSLQNTVAAGKNTWTNFTNSLPLGVTRTASGIANSFGAIFSDVRKLAGKASTGIATTFGNGLKGAGDSITQLGKSFTDLQGKISPVSGWINNYISKPALAAAGAVATIFITKGFNRLVSIDTARSKLSALGHDAGVVDAIMEDALASVKGTAFGLGEAATIAASTVAAGIEPGKELQHVLGLVGDSAAIAGISMDEMGAIFNKIAGSGKLQAAEIYQFTDRGIPLLQMLADELGITAAEVWDFASEGKISFDTFLAAVENGVGGAAVIMGQTSLVGAWDNVWAAISRVGAAFLDAGGTGGGFFSQIKPLLGEFTEMLDAAAPTAEKLGVQFSESFANGVEKVRELIDWWGQLDPNMQKTIGIIGGIAVAAGPVLGVLGTVFGWIGSISGVLGPLMSTLGGAITSAGGMGAALSGAFGKVGGALKFVTGPVGIIVGLIAGMVAASPQLREALGGAFETIGEILGKVMEAVGPLFDKLMDSAVPILEKLGDLFGRLIEAILPVVDALAGALMPVFDLILALVEPFLDIILALVDPIIALADGILNLVTPFLEWGAAILALGIEKLADWLSSWLVPAIEWVSDALETVIGWFKSTGEEGSEASNFLTDAWGKVSQFFTDLWDGIVDVFQGAIDWIVDAFLNWTPLGLIIQHWEPISQFFQGIWDAIVGVFEWAWNEVILPLFQSIGGFIDTWIIQPFNFLRDTITFIWDVVASATQIMWDVVAAIFQQVWDWINAKLAPIFEWLGDTVNTVWTNIQNWIGAAWTTVSGIFTSISNAVRNVLGAVFTWFRDNIIKPVWQFIQDRIQTAKNNIETIFRGIKWVIDNVLAPAFTWLRDNVIKPVWDGIQSAIKTVSDWFRDNVVGTWERATSAVGDAFNKLKDVVGKAWDNIKEAAKKPVKFVVHTIYRDGIKATFDRLAKAVGSSKTMPNPPSLNFASGGVLPGYTPGRDIHDFISPTGGRLRLSGGEAIMRPEFTKALGKDGIAALNRAAKFGKLPTASFAGGGIWDGLVNTVSGVGDWISNAAENIGNILANPADAIKNLILKPIEGWLKELAGGSIIGEIFSSIPRRAVEWITDWFKKFAEEQTTHGNWVGGNTLARIKPILAKYPSLGITSTYRTPAENAAVGGAPRSYHMDRNNPAVDVAGPFGVMDAFAAELRKIGGWRQLLWKVAGHWDHVHVANQGGVFGDLPRRIYDSGGWLDPGLTMAYNATGKREAVLTSEEIALIKQLIASGGRGTVVEEGAIVIKGALDPRRDAYEVLNLLSEEASR